MKKKIIIIIVAVVSGLAVAIGAAFLTGGIQIKKGDYATAPSNEEAIALLTTGKPEGTTPLPEEMIALWLDLNTDIVATGTNAADLTNELFYDYSYITNFDSNTVFIKPDTTGRTTGFVNADGTAFDALAYSVNLADSHEYFKILVADSSLCIKDGQLDFSPVEKLLSGYSFNALMLDTAGLENDENFSKAIVDFSENIKNKFPEIFFGCEFYSLDFSSALYNNELSVAQSGAVDFAVINADCRIGASPSFVTAMSGWNSVAGQLPTVSFYCLHRNDKCYSGINGWDDYLEIFNQYKEMWNFQNFKGHCFYKISEMKARKAASQKLAAIVFDGATEDFEVKQMTVSPTENTVFFAGAYDTDRKVFCNNAEIAGSGGLFSTTYNLEYGDNLFYFENAGQYYKYRIFNNVKFISTAAWKLVDNNTVEVNAVCLSGSTAYAVLGGEIVPLSEGAGENIPAGYTVYSGHISIKGKNISCAELSIVCIYGESNEVYDFGQIALIENAVLTEQTEFKSSVTPFEDHNLGTALMCEIYYDNTEQLGILDAYDTYDPDKSTLVKGMVDYVNQINLTEEGNLRYELRSGVAVYAENCRLINNAFVMPQNNISVYSIDESNLNSTDIVFNYDWLSPVTVSTAPNDYEKGYLEFSFNVETFKAEYIDVKFSYTDSISDIEKLSFADTSVISRAETLKGSDNESTVLRLYLKTPGQFYGFSLEINEENRLCLSLKKHSDNSVAGKVVMIDAGHGGLSMTGTSAYNTEICEADTTLSISRKIAELLTAKGAVVIMTRTDDSSYGLAERAEMCEKYKPDVFLSIHCDGSEKESESGTHTFYYRPYSMPLAAAIHNRLVNNYRSYIYTEADYNYGFIDKEIKYYPFFVTRVDTCPSVLVELGFLTNAVESTILLDSNCQYWLADAVTNGVVDYFASNSTYNVG